MSALPGARACRFLLKPSDTSYICSHPLRPGLQAWSSVPKAVQGTLVVLRYKNQEFFVSLCVSVSLPLSVSVCLVFPSLVFTLFRASACACARSLACACACACVRLSVCWSVVRSVVRVCLHAGAMIWMLKARTQCPPQVAHSFNRRRACK